MDYLECGPDAYERFRFQVTWSGRKLLGVRRVTGLTRATDVIAFRDGASPGPPGKLPGRTDFKAFALDLGPPRNPEFEAWAGQVATLASKKLPAKFRQDMLVELLDEAGKTALALRVHRCWVSEWSFFPPHDATGSAIQRFRIENEGWIREA